MNIRKKWISVILCVSLFLSLIPVSSVRANPEPEEEASIPQKAVEATVIAYSIEEKKDVPVEGAVVTLQQGDTVLVTAVSDAEGKALLSLEGLTNEQLLNTTVQAYVTVDRGKGFTDENFTGRDNLFQNFPKDDDGNYYRFEYQLHSEEIDTNGTWRGHKLPVSTCNQADIVFLIDGTGSMDDNMENVKENLNSFITQLDELNLDIRYSVIEYRDVHYKEMPILHEADGTHWFKDAGTVTGIINEIVADGGGDAVNESLGDALNEFIRYNDIDFRNDAYLLTYVVTDADNYYENRYGSSVWLMDVNEDLKDMCVAVSVVTCPELQVEYEDLYEMTGGDCFDIESPTFGQDLYDVTYGRIFGENAEVELKLSEPRMLVNLSVCYLANDADSQSDAYLDALKNVMDVYSQTLAQTTDGHVYVDKVLLFSTDSLMDFFSTSEQAAMADIQIHTTTDDSNTIRSNAHPGGFYSSEDISANCNLSYFDISDETDYRGRNTFTRIQLSGNMTSKKSFKSDPEYYAKTMVHESGHYILGFYDEYMDQNRQEWDSEDKPFDNFGFMDHQHEIIEMSKRNIGYQYLGGYYSDYPVTTYHFNIFWESCEEVLADLLEQGSISPNVDNIRSSYHVDFEKPFFDRKYYTRYTRVSYNFNAADRKAEYPYAGLEEDDFIILGNGDAAGTDGIGSWDWNIDWSQIADAIGRITPGSGADTFALEVEEEEGAEYTVYIRKLGGEGFIPVDLIQGADGILTADLPVDMGDLAELIIAKEIDGVTTCNTMFLDRSAPAEGYMYASPDGKVMAYGESAEEAAYTFIADNTSYENGEYFSLNQATHIYANGAEMTGGEIYSVASCMADLDFSSISWFKFDGETWTALPTECETDEEFNVGAIADLSGEGLYVLMGKKASEETSEAPWYMTYESSSTVDGDVTISFDDLNENSKYYYVYYSEDLDAYPDTGEMQMMIYEADRCAHVSDTERTFTLNLGERGKMFTVYVEIVQEDGSRSGFASMRVRTEAADRDGDGVPDWFLDKYGLWMEHPEMIAGCDPDGDGWTNLEEYYHGTNPIVPDAPEMAVPVQPEMNQALDAQR